MALHNGTPITAKVDGKKVRGFYHYEGVAEKFVDWIYIPSVGSYKMDAGTMRIARQHKDKHEPPRGAEE